MKRATKQIGFLLLAFGAFLSANAQKAEYKYPEKEEDSIKCLQNINVFDGQFSQDKFTEYSVNAWRWCYKNGPMSTRLIYSGGVDFYTYNIKEAKKAKKTDEYQLYIDSLMMVYNRRLELFGKYGDSGITVAKMAIALYRYRNNKFDALAEIVRLSEMHNRITGERRLYAIPQVHFGSMDRLVKYKKLDTSYIINSYIDQIGFIKEKAAPEIQEIEEAQKKADENPDGGIKVPKPRKWARTLENVENVMSKYLTCEVLVPLYDRMLKTELKQKDLENMLNMMQKKGCEESPVYFLAAEKLCEIEPSAACKVALGDRAFSKDKDYNLAKTFYKEALELEKTDKEMQGTIWLKIASADQKLGANSSAISGARKALGFDNTLGKAYIIIAAATTKIAQATCTGNNFERAATNWVIVDYYMKAKSVDPSLASVADAAIANHSKHFPTKQEIFFETLKEGDTYMVECLGTSTIIRARKE